MIDGISQSTGIERLVEITAAEAGIRLGIRDRKLGTELSHVTVPADELMSILSEQPKGPQTITGGGRTLEMEVRRNEVWLTRIFHGGCVLLLLSRLRLSASGP